MKAQRSRWIPYAFIGFFLVVVAVNGTMVAIALSSWTGLAVTDAYERGRTYNRTIEQVRRQKALGWRSEPAFEVLGEGRGRLELRLLSADGRPIDSADVVVRAVRPTHEGYDFDTVLIRRGGGRYMAEIEFPLAGVWDLEIEARRGDDRYRHDERVRLP